MPVTRSAQQPDETGIREILRVQTEAWNQGDGKAWARDFSDDSDFVNVRGDVFHGKGEIADRHSAILRGPFKGSHLSLSVRRFRLLTPEVALIETDHELTHFPGMVPGIAPTSEGVLRTHMKYVAVKRDNRWQFVAAQNTAILPPIAQH